MEVALAGPCHYSAGKLEAQDDLGYARPPPCAFSCISQVFRATRMGIDSVHMLSCINAFALVIDKKRKSGIKVHATGGSQSDLWETLSDYVLDSKQDSDGTNGSQKMLGLSTSLFENGSLFDMEEEEASNYVPVPIIDASDLETNKQLEEVLYIMKDVLDGSMKKDGKEHKLYAAWRLISNDIKVQDPLACMRGKERLLDWLGVLADSGTVVNLHEIYLENNRAFPSRRWMYAVWTVSWTGDFSNQLQNFTSKKVDGLSGQNIVCHDNLRTLDSERGSTPPSKCMFPSELNLSGESKFEMDNAGQVLSVESKWYILKDGGEEVFEASKLWLSTLLNKKTK